MAQKTMYSAVNNSIQATLTASIAATDTIIPLSSVSYLPAAPNLVTIGTDDDAEVIRYNGIDGLTLTGCERGFDGTTAKVWLVNEVVYRAYTHYDHETFKSNIEDLDTDKLAKTGDGSSTTVSFTAATQRTALATNSKLSVLFGLLSKWLTDLKGLAFKDKVTSSDFEDNAVSNSALAQMAAKTIKGNATAAAASPTDLSASDVRSLLNVADGADVTATEIAGASTASSMADSDTIPIVSGKEIKRVTPSVLKTKLGSDLPTGGSAGQVLTKNSAENYDASWKSIDVSALYPTITVNDTANTAVTASRGSTTLNGTTDSAGVYTFTIPSRGTWTLSDGTNTKTVVVDSSTDYEIDLNITIMGVKRSTLATSTAWTRTDASANFTATASVGTSAGSSDFDTMPIYKDIKRVTEDTGDVMVEIPAFYYRRYRDSDNMEYIQIADGAADGFVMHPAFLRGGVQYSAIRVGAYKMTANYTSKSGLAPLVNLTRAAFRAGAQAKGTGWGIIDLAAWSAVAMLILVEFADNDVQTVIGAGWSNSSAAKNTGTCDSVPNLTGRPAGTSNAVDVVWRGIEGFWANVWEWLDGINWNNGSFYVCNDPSLYADDTATGYTVLDFQGSTSWSSSYITAEGLDTDAPWAILPSAAGSGSATTYYADGCWSSTGWRVCKRGGNWSDGTICGLFALNVNNASSNTNSNNGSRLLLLIYILSYRRASWQKIVYGNGSSRSTLETSG